MLLVYLQSLKLLRLNIEEENIYKKIQYLTFDLVIGVKVIRDNAQYPLQYVTYVPSKLLCLKVKEEIHLHENTVFDHWP